MMGSLGRARLIALVLTLCAGPVSGRDVLVEARASYVAARYDHALALLDAVDADTAATAEAHRLRAVCLLALGRVEEAERAIARAVAIGPAEALPSDVSPRVRGVFRAVRDRVLPVLAVERYESGKAAFERRDFTTAIREFEAGLPLLEMLAQEGQSEMEARRVLATDFLALSRQLLPPVVEVRPALDARPPVATWTVPVARTVAAPLQTPPIVVRQDLPPWPYALGQPYATFRGAIDVSIDATGVVVDAVVVASVHPRYDQDLMRAARTWRYEPARRAGRPVATTKRVEVVVGEK
jgi:TonB family protein